MELSKRVQAIKPSPTLAVTARAARLKAEGKDIIGLGAGEPDFDTPQHIKDAAIIAINQGFTKYTAVGGTPGLKNAIIAKFKRDNGFDYTAKQILVSCGGKQSFFNLILSVIDPGDEVIIPAPYWVSYPDIVLIAEGKPIIVEAGIEQGFKITAAQLEEAITHKTRMFVINSPSNPSGGVYTSDELKALGEVLLKYPDVLIATDDMYEHILLSGGRFVNILNACPALYDRTIVLNGVSKAYAMTGWRIGYCGGPAQIITAMENIQSQSTSNPASISQVAAEAALNGDQSCIVPMVEAFKERNEFVTGALNALPGVRCLPSGGAFYAFADTREAIGQLHRKGVLKDGSDIAFSEYLLEQGGVAVVPGSAFGSEGYIRLSFATTMTNLENALRRIAKALG
ncbi:MAG: pyridoxal phosphate-dependent aminotransferase [Nitrosospira sp.]|nr:pyridoxal phosphate-dependent aminotransferase [Nitrosospira sp.]MDN5935257.1 pyridoxal phosphate-dependent aminotransferase [Nitrosospira sp.]